MGQGHVAAGVMRGPLRLLCGEEFCLKRPWSTQKDLVDPVVGWDYPPQYPFHGGSSRPKGDLYHRRKQVERRQVVRHEIPEVSMVIRRRHALIFSNICATIGGAAALFLPGWMCMHWAWGGGMEQPFPTIEKNLSLTCGSVFPQGGGGGWEGPGAGMRTRTADLLITNYACIFTTCYYLSIFYLYSLS